MEIAPGKKFERAKTTGESGRTRDGVLFPQTNLREAPVISFVKHTVIFRRSPGEKKRYRVHCLKSEGRSGRDRRINPKISRRKDLMRTKGEEWQKCRAEGRETTTTRF